MTPLSPNEKLAQLNNFRAAEGLSPYADWRTARHQPMLDIYFRIAERAAAKAVTIDNEIADAGNEPDALLIDPKTGEMERESEVVKVEDVAPVSVSKAKLPSYKQMAHVNKSGIENPVKFIHAWLDENNDVGRKVAVATLVGLGVAYATARTQYQRWFSARKGK